MLRAEPTCGEFSDLSRILPGVGSGEVLYWFEITTVWCRIAETSVKKGKAISL
jgi:hypothetical protein